MYVYSSMFSVLRLNFIMLIGRFVVLYSLLLFILQLVVLVFISVVSIQTLVQNVFVYWPGMYTYVLC